MGGLGGWRGAGQGSVGVGPGEVWWGRVRQSRAWQGRGRGGAG